MCLVDSIARARLLPYVLAARHSQISLRLRCYQGSQSKQASHQKIDQSLVLIPVQSSPQVSRPLHQLLVLVLLHLELALPLYGNEHHAPLLLPVLSVVVVLHLPLLHALQEGLFRRRRGLVLNGRRGRGRRRDAHHGGRAGRVVLDALGRRVLGHGDGAPKRLFRSALGLDVWSGRLLDLLRSREGCSCWTRRRRGQKGPHLAEHFLERLRRSGQGVEVLDVCTHIRRLEDWPFLVSLFSILLWFLLLLLLLLEGVLDMRVGGVERGDGVGQGVNDVVVLRRPLGSGLEERGEGLLRREVGDGIAQAQRTMEGEEGREGDICVAEQDMWLATVW